MAQIDTLTNVGAVVSTDLALILRGGANVLGTLGSMVGQNSTAVTITGGTINGTVIGGTTAAAGSFTTGAFSSTLGVTGAATFGANIGLNNAYYLTGKLVAGTSVALIGRAADDRVTIDPDGYGVSVIGAATFSLGITATTGTFSGNVSIDTSGNPQMLVKTSGAGNNPSVRIQADTNYWDLQTIFSNATNDFDIRYNGASRLNITSAGAATFSAGISATTGTFSGYIDLQTGGVTKGNIYTDASTLIINTQGTNTTLNTNGGNVGIGTSLPVTLKSATTLQVSGNAKLGDDNGRGLLSLGDIASTGANAGIWRGAAGAYAGIGNYLNLGGYDGITFTTGAADISAQTERMRIDASGNVGIGTSLPQEKTHSVGRILSTTQYGASTQRIGTSIGENGNTRADIDFRRWTGAAANHGVGMIDVAETGVMAFYTDTKTSNTPATTERMRIDASGNVGIGVSSPADTFGGFGTLDASGPLVSRGQIGQHQTNAGVFQYGANVTSIRSYGATAGSGIISFKTGGGGVEDTERMRIDASGNVGIGTSSFPSSSVAGFMFTGDQLYTSAGAVTTTNYQVRFYNGNGLVGAITTDGSATAYLTSSDQRLKENIADADDAGSKIDAIQVRKFDWKVDGSHQDYGMVAQELMIVAPEAVSAPEDPEEMMGVDYSKLVPMMLKEIQSLRARISQLEGAK